MFQLFEDRIDKVANRRRIIMEPLAAEVSVQGRRNYLHHLDPLRLQVVPQRESKRVEKGLGCRINRYSCERSEREPGGHVHYRVQRIQFNEQRRQMYGRLDIRRDLG